MGTCLSPGLKEMTGHRSLGNRAERGKEQCPVLMLGSLKHPKGYRTCPWGLTKTELVWGCGFDSREDGICSGRKNRLSKGDGCIINEGGTGGRNRHVGMYRGATGEKGERDAGTSHS